MNRHALGLTRRDRVNAAFGGGFPPGSIVYVEGADGAGKSVLSQRIAYGMASEGIPVAYLSTELTLPEFLDQMNSLSYDVVEHLLADRMLFLHAPVAGDEWSEATKRELLGRLLSAEHLWRGEVTIVDSFDALLRNDTLVADGGVDGSVGVVETLTKRLRRITAGGQTIVLTADPHGVEDRMLKPLRRVTDVYLQVEMKEVGQEIRRNVVVRRFAGMASPVDDTIGFTVQQGRGITIESRTVA